jgi:hypothetical protein
MEVVVFGSAGGAGRILLWLATSMTNSNATAEDRDLPVWNLPGITLPVALTKSSSDHTSIWLQPLWRRNSR